MPKRNTNADAIQQSVFTTLSNAVPDGGFLGHAAAIVVVTRSANTSPVNLPRSLQELGLDGLSFQGSVFNGVRKAGCTIGIDDIPDSADTTLIQVVNVVQDAPKAG